MMSPWTAFLLCSCCFWALLQLQPVVVVAWNQPMSNLIVRSVVYRCRSNSICCRSKALSRRFLSLPSYQGSISLHYSLGSLENTDADNIEIRRPTIKRNITRGLNRNATSQTSEKSSLWHQIDVLLTIGQAGLTDAHINSLREYLHAHNAVKVKLSSSQLPITVAEVAAQIQSSLSSPSKSMVLSLSKATKAVEIGNIDIRGRCMLLQRLELLPEKKHPFSLNKNFKTEERKEKKVSSKKVNKKKTSKTKRNDPGSSNEINIKSNNKKTSNRNDAQDSILKSSNAASAVRTFRSVGSRSVEGNKVSKKAFGRSSMKQKSATDGKHTKKNNFLSKSINNKSDKVSSSSVKNNAISVKEKLARFIAKKDSDKKRTLRFIRSS